MLVPSLVPRPVPCALRPHRAAAVGPVTDAVARIFSLQRFAHPISATLIASLTHLAQHP